MNTNVDGLNTAYAVKKKSNLTIFEYRGFSKETARFSLVFMFATIYVFYEVRKPRLRFLVRIGYKPFAWT